MHLFSQAMQKDTTLNRVVVVENEYNPTITDVSKINLLPAVEEPVPAPRNIEYAVSESPAKTFGAYYPLSSYTDMPVRPDAKRGYARLGYGNYGNVAMELDYLFRVSGKDQVVLAVFLNGMNGKLKLPDGLYGETADWKSRFYASGLKFGYTHLFQKLRLEIMGDWGTDLFNYRQRDFADTDGIQPFSSGLKDNQQQVKGQVYANLVSADNSLPLQFDLKAGYAYFKKKYMLGQTADDREQIAMIKAESWGEINEFQKVGLKLNLNSFFYSFKAYDNYTSLETNPYYTFGNKQWKLRLGAHVDFSFGKGSMLEVAPDIDLQYLFARNYSFYLNVTGGRTFNDYRQLERTDPYWAVYTPSWWTNSYVPADASLGFRLSPLQGMRIHLFAGYRVNHHELCFGEFLPGADPFVYSYVQTKNLKRFYTGTELSYTYKDLADFSALFTYNRWNDHTDKLLLMKPEIAFKCKVSLKLVTSLYVDLGYELISRPEVLLDPEENLSAYRMKPINNLSMGLTCSFWRGVSAFAKLDNLLNREYQYFYAYPSEKLNFLAGFSCKF